MATADVLVTGATGNTGRPLVEKLLTRNTVVRVMVRSADAQPRSWGAPDRAATVR